MNDPGQSVGDRQTSGKSPKTRLQRSDHRQRALASPENCNRGAPGGNGPAAEAPRPPAQILNQTKQRPSGQNDRELADFHACIEGKQAMPDVRRIDLKNLVQDKRKAETVKQADCAGDNEHISLANVII